MTMILAYSLITIAGLITSAVNDFRHAGKSIHNLVPNI
jgi:hypothetical protein